jgi:hypothetical protein
MQMQQPPPQNMYNVAAASHLSQISGAFTQQSNISGLQMDNQFDQNTNATNLLKQLEFLQCIN